MGTARYYVQGTGTQSAAIIMGGNPGSKDVVETYDGTSWTEVNDILTGRRNAASAGTQTTAMYFGGQIATPPDGQVKNEEYDGTSWTEGNDLTAAQQMWWGVGTNTAAFGFGGKTTTPGTIATITQTWYG